MKYRVVTGWYPSKATAEKVLGKVKSHNSEATIHESDGFYTVEIGVFDYMMEAQKAKDFMKDNGIGCGIEVV